MKTFSKAVRFVVGILLSSSTIVSQENKNFGPTHGTCAVAIFDKFNMAIVVDSWLTYSASPNPCLDRSLHHNPQNACKAAVVRDDVLVATTGNFIDPEGKELWSFPEHARLLLSALPKSLSKEDIDEFGKNWIQAVGEHYERKIRIDGRNALPRSPIYDISTLLVLTRIKGIPYGVRLRTQWNGNKFGVIVSEATLPSVGPTVMFAGSCRDDVLKPDRAPLNVPSSQDKFETALIRDSRMTAKSVTDFVNVGIDYEKVLARGSQRQNKCYIGPPYDIATWSYGETSWKDHFKEGCGRANK